MKTAIYDKVKRLAALLLVGGAMTSNIVAQESIHLFYRNLDHQKIEITDDTQIEFVKQSYIIETNYSVAHNPDTLFFPASAGSAITALEIESNAAWKAEVDADWLMTYCPIPDSLKENYYFSRHNGRLMVAVLPNTSAEQRTAMLTLLTKDGKAQRQFTVVQRPYALTFANVSYINNYRFDGEPVVLDTALVKWNATESYHYLIPNHGVSVVSYPEWMEFDTLAFRGEDYSFAWQKENVTSDIGRNTVARFRFSPNLDATSRSGEVVFEGSNGQRVTSFVVQEGLNEVSVLQSAADLHQGLYEPFIVGSGNHTDFGLPAMMLYLDSRGADMVSTSTGYNWFANSLKYWDRLDTYYPTHIAWRTLYYNIKEANSIIALFGQNDDPLFRAYLAQAYALRAFDYFYLAQIYQHTYVGNEDALCIPLVTEENMAHEYTSGIPRATVSEVYDYILENLNKAIVLLEGNTIAYPDKELMSLEAAYALRARVYLVMNKWVEAAADAQRVLAAGTAVPYSMEQVSKPGFYDINDAAWLWGIKVEETDNAVATGIVNWPSHMCSMSGYGYATTDPGVQRRISKALWVSIPRTDVRKGWWLDDKMQSPLLVNAYGEDVAAELPYAANMAPFTNVKFGPEGGEPLNSTNAQDIPLIRIEEVYLILAEAQAMAGDVENAVNTLNSFVSTYRDPVYNCTATTAEEVQEAVWQQRRIELWGEGLAYYDLMRLKKPVDRRGAGFEYNYVFNIPDGDAARIYQIPSTEMDRNVALVQNPLGDYDPQPVEDYEVEIPNPDDEQWKSLGMATYTEDLMTSFFNTENVTYEVEVQENVENPGMYRLVNAYGAAYPYNGEGDYDASKNYYIVIDARNPEQVSIDLSYTGMNWGYGEFFVWSMAQYVMDNGGTEADAYPYWGKLENGVITFPTQALVSGMGEQYMTYGNKNGKFSVVLPGAGAPNEEVQWKSLGMAAYTEDLITTFFKVENVTYDVEVQENVETPGIYRLVNAYGAAYPYNAEGDYDASKDYYIVIDARNPEQVSIDLSYTGMNWGYGEFFVWSMAQYAMANGGTEEDALPYWGKLENGVITFPGSALISGMGEDYMNYGNKNGKFAVVLPGYEQSQPEFTEKVGTGTYNYTQVFGGSYEYDLYRDMNDPNRYCIKDWCYDVDFVFTWNEDSIHVEPQFIGYTHSTYGDVYVMDVDDYAGKEMFPSYYDEETRTLYFGLVYYVTEGTFGHGYETFVLTEEQAEAIGRMRERQVTTLDMNATPNLVPEVNPSLKLVSKKNVSRKLISVPAVPLKPVSQAPRVLKLVDASMLLK